MSDHLVDHDLEPSTRLFCCLASRLVDAAVHLALDLHRFDCLLLLLQFVVELSQLLVVVSRAHLAPQAQLAQLLTECVLVATSAQQETFALRQLIFYYHQQRIQISVNYKASMLMDFVL